MKVALCLHGQARGLGLLTDCSPVSIDYQNKNLLKRDDVSVDVFFHTWDYSKSIRNFKQRIIDLYSPKSFMFESPLDWNFVQQFKDGSAPPEYVYSNYSHYHSVYFSDLKRIEYEQSTGQCYDWVICTRFDVALNVRLDFDSLDKSKVYQSDFNMDQYMSNGLKVQNPVFAVGGGENMKKYSAMLTNLQHLLDSSHSIDGHSIFGANLKYQGLIDSMMHLDMNHPFPPRGRDASPNSFVRDDFHSFMNLQNT